MVRYINRIQVIFVVCGVLTALSGCSESFIAHQYPSFYDPNLRTVAVVPFQNDTTRRGAGIMASDSLSAALHANGTYRIVPPRKLQALVEQKKLRALSRTDYQKDAGEFRELGGIQAFVTGKVLSSSTIAGLYPGPYGYASYYYPVSYSSGSRGRYELVDEDEEGEEGDEDEGFDDDFYDFYGPYYPYYWYYPEYTAQALVTLEASLIRVSDGAVLYTTSVPVQGRADLGSYHRITPASATLDAMNQVAAKLVKDMAVVPVKVKVNPRADIKTAVAKENGRWKFSNRFSPNEQQMYVVMQLPTTVAHDTFRLTITPRGRPDDVIIAKNVTWPRDRNMDAVMLSPKEIADRAGTGKYSVGFYSMGKSVMQHHFTIK